MKHVYLTEENGAKLERAAQATGRSVNEIVNSIVSSVDEIQITQVVIFKPKPPSKPSPGRRKRPKTLSVWKIHL